METFNNGNMNARKGIAWLINKTEIEKIKAKYTINTHNDKISLLKLQINTKIINVIGVYLPSLNSCSDEDYKLDLMQIQNVMNRECKSDDITIILGDFNADPGRKDGLPKFQDSYSEIEYYEKDFKTTWKYKRDKMLWEHINEHNLCNISTLNLQLPNYTLKKRENMESSRIDHILMSESSNNQIDFIQANILCSTNELKELAVSTGTKHMRIWDELNNVGDHRALQLKISIRQTRNEIVSTTTTTAQTKISTSLRWYDNDTVESYNQILWHEFQTCEIENLIKTQGNAIDVTNLMIEKITNSAATAKSEYFKTSKHTKCKEWWDNEMTELKEKRNHWYHIKMTAKADTNEFLKAETKYHHYRQIFKIKQKEKLFMQENANCHKLNRLHHEDCTKIRFWRHIKTIRKDKAETIDVPIDQLEEMYDDLFNKKISTASNVNEDELNNENMEFERECQREPSITVQEKDIADLMEHELANNKAPGHKNLSNEAFKNIDFVLIIFIIKYIFEEFFNFKRVAEYFNTGMITLLIKDKKKPSNDINNLRPIMLSDIWANLMEKLFLKLMSPWIKLSPYQFGFRENHSCLHAITVARETILYYLARNKPVYGVAIDFTKAFDKTSRKILFSKLQKKIPNRLWSSIFNYYDICRAFVRNNNMESKTFKTSIGVKQGGPMSPFLFAFFIDNMLQQLASLPGICNINGQVTGVVAYADDILLLCESEGYLKNAMAELERLCDDLNLVINQGKTKTMVFGNTKQRKLVLNTQINKVNIECVESIKYLGVILNNSMTSGEHLNSRIEKFQRSIYGIGSLGISNHNINATLKAYLLKVYCLPVLLYGCECTYYNKTQLNNTKRCFTVMFKRCLNLNKQLRNDELLYATNIEPIITLIHRKKINALILLCKNKTIRDLFENIISGTDYQQSNNQIKKSFIYECSDIIEEDITSIELLLNGATTYINGIDGEYEIMRNSDEVNEVRWLLEHPNAQNWFQLNQLLIPTQIEKLQEQYWECMLTITDNAYLETNEIMESRLNADEQENAEHDGIG
jgi:hypothetical protein